MIIDSIYEGVIAKLTEQGQILKISQKLLTITSNEERVYYVSELLKELRSLPDAIKVEKCETLSTQYRNLGNEQFKIHNDYEAWQYYNLSLLYAPLESDNFALAIANRSAIFYSLSKYEECLIDIDMVLGMEYPAKLKDKLLNRQLQCRQSLVDKKEKFDKDQKNQILKIREPKNDRYICASAVIDVVTNDEMGRHVIAKDDIKVGEVIAIEKPYFTLLLKSQILFICSYCLSRNANLIPCTSCCFALYCNEECKEKANKEYHRIECPIMAMVIDMDFTKIELLSLRTVIKARLERSDWDSFLKLIQEIESNTGENRGHVNVDGKWVYDSKYYHSIHTLASNIEKRSISDIFQKCVTAAVFLDLLIKQTMFIDVNVEEKKVEIKKCVGGLLLLHNMTSATNMHGLSTNQADAQGNYVDEISIASAPYPFLSLLNHSCAPNVVRYHEEGTGKMTLIALRPIKKGMQLFDNYGSHHALQSRFERHKSLKFQYKFDCFCEACVNDWPIYIRTNRGKNIPKEIRKRKNKVLNPAAIEDLQKGKLKAALRLFKPLCELLSDLDKYAPCVELAHCQESLKQCLFILHGVVPHGYSKLIKWI